MSGGGELLRKKLKAAAEGFKEGYSTGSHVCTQCGVRVKPKTFTKGSFAIEIILWLCLIVPGLIYTIWRSSTRYTGCPDCKTQTMVKADSPIGKQLLSGQQ